MLATHEYAPFRGGVAIYVQEIASAAREAGFAVEVWTVNYRHRPDLPPQREEGTFDSPPAFPVVRFWSNGRLTPGGLLTLAWGFCRNRRRLRAGPVILMSVGAQMVFFWLDLLGSSRRAG